MKALTWRLNNISLFLKAGATALASRRHRKFSGIPRTVIIVQGAKMGDMVCTTPVFRATKEAYPSCRVVVVGDTVNEKLLEGHPHVDRYIVWQGSFSEMATILENEQADAGILILPSLLGLALLLEAKVPFIIAPRVLGGSSPYETRTYKLLTAFVTTAPHHFDAYAPREYLRLLEPLAIFTENTKKHLTYPKTSLESVREKLAQKGIDFDRDLIAGIGPSVGGDRAKRWAPEKFATVAHGLIERGAKVVVIGSGRDKEDIEEMMNTLVHEPRAVNLLDALTLAELKAFISKLSLYISADTGPIYIAEAFDTPTIDIVGPVKEQVQPPRGANHRIVMAARASGVMGVLDNMPSDRRELRRQSEEITPGMVLHEVDDLLSTLPLTTSLFPSLE
ncbi:MAG: glycosyltransferase family 9 protein [Patescibacteria group bacterium]